MADEETATPMARIYISSTYQDLVEERKGAIYAVRRLWHQPVNMEDYGAVSTPSIKKCLDDVRSCDGFIGILGREYGSIPADSTDGKSFIQREYEAAEEQGIPCWFFRLEGESGGTGQPQDERLRSLVEHVEGRWTVATFADARSLREEVAYALKRELGQGKRRGELLPFYCNRDDQRRKLTRFVLEAKEAANRQRPVVAVLYGDEDQSHHRFAECLKERYMSEILGRGDVSVQEYKHPVLKAQSASGIEEEITDWLGQEVCGRMGITLDAVATGLSARGEPVLITAQLSSTAWSSRVSSQVLRAAVRFWTEWPHLLHGSPVVVLFVIRFLDLPRRGFFRRRSTMRKNREIQRAIEDLRGEFEGTGLFLCLPRLEDVSMEEVAEWAGGDEVLEFTGNKDLTEAVRQFYDERDRLPMAMAPLGEELHRMLRRACANRS